MRPSSHSLLLVLFFCATVDALTFIGPPTTALQEGQVAVEARYAWSQNDVDVEGLDVRNVDLETILGAVRVGIAEERLEIFGLLGAGQIQDVDWNFAYGGGLKVTMNLDRPLSWGLAIQAVHHQLRESPFTDEIPWVAELDIWDIQIAAGPCWRFDKAVIYGGPMLHFIQGDIDINERLYDPEYSLDIEAEESSLDVEQENWIGAYIGGELSLGRHIGLGAEFQITPGAMGAGATVQIRF